MPAIKIYDKLTSLRYIFLYQVWLFTRPKFRRKFIQRADVLHTVCFPTCLLKICAKCEEGQCWNFFPGLLCMHEFFSLNFLCMNVFGTSPPPPITFLMVCPLARLITSSESQGAVSWVRINGGESFHWERGRRAPGMLLLTNKFHDSFECFSVIGHTK